MKKRILSALLVLVLFVSLMPAAYADSCGMKTATPYINKGTEFTVTYELPAGVLNAGAAAITVSFNPELLRAEAIAFAEVSGAEWLYTPYETVNIEGKIAATVISDSSFSLGRGTPLVTVQFSPLTSGASEIELTDLLVLSAEGDGTEVLADMSTVKDAPTKVSVSVRNYITDMYFSSEEITVRKGYPSALELTAEGTQNNTERIPVSYSSDAPEIVAVDDNGIVTGLDVGTATITATAAQYSAEITVNVIEQPKYTVTATSCCGELTGVAMLEGGGIYLENETATLIAHSGKNMSFIGWFDSMDAAEPISTESVYEFVVTGDVNLYARYSAQPTVRLIVNGNDFAVNGEIQTGNYSDDVLFGETVTLSYVGAGSFSGWANASGMIVSRDRHYVIDPILIDTELTAVASDDYISAYVMFVSQSGQLIAAENVSTDDNIEMPAGPSALSAGDVFIGWTMDGVNAASESDIMAEISGGAESITLYPLYRSDGSYRTVSIYADGKLFAEQRVAAGTTLLFTAPEIEGKHLYCWTVNDDLVPVSVSESFKMLINTDIVIYARYASEPSAVLECAGFSMTGVYSAVVDGRNKLVFEATRDVPDTVTIVEQGIIYSVVPLTDEDFVLNDDGTPASEHIRVVRLASTENRGTAKVSITVSDGSRDTVVYARGYMITREAYGTEVYFSYTTTVHASYNELLY